MKRITSVGDYCRISSERLLVEDLMLTDLIPEFNLQELKGLLHDLLRKEAKGSCITCGADVNEKLRLEVREHKTFIFPTYFFQ